MVSFIASMGFVLSSTAVIMQMLEERGEASTATGQKAVSILLLEDLAIVPLLAIVAALAPAATGDGTQASSVMISIGALAGLIIVGRWAINPMFRLLAAAQAREVMTAAALLVVLGAAYLMELGGLSMAMGAFVAGVLLSESTFRHQLEADIEPFRGILLGLFFLAIGMSLDLIIIAAQWQTILRLLACFMLAKALGIFAVALLSRENARDAMGRVALFTQGGEFAFVLYAAALAVGIFNAEQSAIFSAVVILSMALTPLTARLIAALMPTAALQLDGIESAEGLEGNVLIIGFGRFGQVVSQPLLARGFAISLIESDVEMIRSASNFGFKVYYGDGTRLDVLKASGAAKAEAIIVCVDSREAADKIVALVQSEFPLTKLFVRAFDRGHAMHLIRRNVDVQVRETFESAMLFGEMALRELGVPDDAVVEIMEDTRRRDAERLELQVAGDIRSGIDLMRKNDPRPAPLTKPRQPVQAFNVEDGVAAPFTPLSVD
jgi:glutathione-regulated potassium-efflux system protein KefB